jgi:hypothetical protein
MGEFYKILTASKLGDPYESHGKKIQSWWCQVEGQDKDMMIGKMEGTEVRPGQHNYGDLILKTSKKGTEYWKFQGAKVPDGVTPPADEAVASVPAGEQFDMPAWFIPYGNMIEQMYKAAGLHDDGIIEGAKPAIKHEPKEDVVATSEDIDDMFNDSDEINLDDIPF